MKPASFDWRDFLPLARELAKNGDAASQRTAVSRAYYAAFHYAQTFLLRKGYNKPGKNDPNFKTTHKWVWSTLQSSGDPDYEDIGTDGADLLESRVAADYYGNVPHPKGCADAAIESAEDLLNRLWALR